MNLRELYTGNIVLTIALLCDIANIVVVAIVLTFKFLFILRCDVREILCFRQGRLQRGGGV